MTANMNYESLCSDGWCVRHPSFVCFDVGWYVHHHSVHISFFAMVGFVRHHSACSLECGKLVLSTSERWLVHLPSHMNVFTA